MGLVDLTAADDLTFPEIKALVAAATRKVNDHDTVMRNDRVAFLTVTSTWWKSTFVANGIIRSDKDGIITDYAESTGIWSSRILNSDGMYDIYPDGCKSLATWGQLAIYRFLVAK
jgi:hypothetical protein